MLAIILYVFRSVRLLGSGHQAVAVENLALRLQLAAYRRKRKRPVVTQWGRLFWNVAAGNEGRNNSLGMNGYGTITAPAFHKGVNHRVGAFVRVPE
jgi:hypothetical protein